MSNRVVLGTVIGLVAGFALAWMLKPAERVEPEPAPEVGEQPRESPPAEGAMTPEPTDPGPRLEAPVPRPGVGAIKGVVRTMDGDPVEGVRITAELNDTALARALHGDPSKDESLDAEVKRAVDAVHRRRAARRTAVTGKDGSFTLANLIDGRYRLSAMADGYEIRASSGSETWRAKPGSEVEFLARAAVRIEVSVIRSDGAEPERATIIYGKDPEDLRGGRMGWASTHREVPFDVGEWWVSAEVRDDPGAKGRPVAVDCRPGHAPERVTIVLGNLPGLRGNVVFPEGFPKRAVDVYGRRFEGEQAPAWSRRARRGWERARVDGGVYHFKTVESGRWAVVAVIESQAVASDVVTVPDRLVEHDLQMPVPDMSRYFRVNITGPDGEHLSDLRFMLEFSSARGGGGAPVAALEGSGGAWYLQLASSHAVSVSTPKAGDRFPEGTYTLRTTHRTFGEIVTPFDPNALESLDLRFQQKINVEVTVRGLKEAGLVDVVSLYRTGPPKPTGLTLVGSPAQAVGEVFKLKGQQPGPIHLRALYREPGDRRVTKTLFVERVELSASNDKIVIPLPALHDLDVEVKQEDGRPSSLSLNRVDEGNRWSHSHAYVADGEASFSHIPPGRYELIGRRRDGKTFKRVVNIPADRRVLIE